MLPSVHLAWAPLMGALQVCIGVTAPMLGLCKLNPVPLAVLCFVFLPSFLTFVKYKHAGLARVSG